MSDHEIILSADATARTGTHHWVALRDNGKTGAAEVLVAEYDEDGVRRHPFADVLGHLDELTEVSLLPHDEDGVRYAVVLDPADHATRPIFFRRRTFEDVMNNPGDAVPKLTCLGFQKTVVVGDAEVNVKALLFIFPDGTVVLSDQDTF
jgi:hypothetical protein